MGIIRAPRTHDFLIIPNGAVRDARLSYRARGVLARLLSNADGFRTTAIDLARESTDGRYAVLAALSELRKAGYLLQKKLRNDIGQWSTETYVYDFPQVSENTEVRFTGVGKPDPGSPDPGSPDAGSPDPIKKISKQISKKISKKKTTTTSNPSRSKPAGGGGCVDSVIQDIQNIREMLVAQAKAFGKTSPAAWVGAAVRRIRKDGLDADTQAQFEDWKAGKARAEATERAVQAARNTSPCDTTTTSPISRSSYPGRVKLMEAIRQASPVPAVAGSPYPAPRT